MSKINAEPLLMIEACAGSGKTFSLVHRFLSIFFSNKSNSSILATTFSRKAAREILIRILERLVEGSEDSRICNELIQLTGAVDLKAHDIDTALSKFIIDANTHSIGTLDSFAQALARLFHPELSLPEKWTIPDANTTLELQNEALLYVLEDESKIEFGKGFEDILGQGARRSVTENIKKLLVALRPVVIALSENAFTWKEEELLNINFSNLESEEIVLEKLKNLSLPVNASSKKGSEPKPNLNWQKAHNSVIQAFANRSYDEVLNSGFCSKIYSGESTYYKVDIADEWHNAYQSAILHALNFAIKRIITKTHKLYELTLLYANYYEQLSSDRRMYGFDDIKIKLASTINDISNIDISYRLDRLVQHVLLDEFQDTSSMDWQFISPIVEEIAAAPSMERTFFAVGDPKQSIYGWRGGSAQLFDYIRNKYPQVGEEPLITSYRSSQIILDFVNKLYSNISESLSFENYQNVVAEWSKSFAPHKAAKVELDGHVLVKKVSTENEPIEEQLAREVQELISKNSHLKIAILVRKNSELVPIAAALNNLGIDISTEGGRPLTDSPFVVAVCSLLHWVIYPTDTRSFYHVLATPLKALFSNSEQFVALNTIAIEANKIRLKIFNHGMADFIVECGKLFSVASDINDQIRADQLLEMAVLFDAANDFDLENFINQVRLKRIEEEGQGVVRLMTIHKSKGLEFDAVFLTNLDWQFNKVGNYNFLYDRDKTSGEVSRIIAYADKNLRNYLPRLDDMYESAVGESIKEELSVLYVALTRAKHGLYILLDENPPRNTICADALIRGLFLGGEELYPSGRHDWWHGVGAKKEQKTKNSDGYLLDFSSGLTANSTKRRFLPQRTATEVAGLENSSLLFSNIGSSRGNQYHYLAEILEWIEDCDWLKGEDHLSIDVSEEHLLNFKRQVLIEPIRTCFSRARYPAGSDPKVFRELPFAFCDSEEGGGEQIVTGIIDRVVVYHDSNLLLNIELFDLKTGYLGTESEILHDLIAGQLRIYASAMKKLYPTVSHENIRAFGCFIDRAEVIEVRLL